MNYGLTVTIDGDVVLQKKLVTVQHGLGSFKPLWPQVIAWFSASEQRQFASEGGGTWHPLARSTVKRRGSAHPILDDTGRFKSSLVNPTFRYEADNMIELGTSYMVNGHNLGQLHRRGTRRMPARDPLHPSRDDLGALREIFHRYILDLMSGGNVQEQVA